MTAARGTVAPSVPTSLGNRKPRKDEAKKTDAGWSPAPGSDPGKHIEVGPGGKLRTNDPRNPRN